MDKENLYIDVETCDVGKKISVNGFTAVVKRIYKVQCRHVCTEIVI